jgi:ribosomal-protein-alanine N-acetyltransferase
LRFVRKGHLVSIAVLQSYRSLGIGRSLLLKVLEGLSLSNASECYLEVRITNSSGIKLYTSAGFKIIRTAPLYYHDGADAYVMVRNLLFSH